MNEIFISPILLDYKYLESLSAEASSILKIDLKDEQSHKEFLLSIFLNFNRFLIMKIELTSNDPLLKNGIYEELSNLMEKNDEEETIKLLTKLEILPKAREEFLEIFNKK